MGEVTITVNGRPYRMACEDGQEGHLVKLGESLADRVADLARQLGQVGDAQLLVMAALIQADEVFEAAAAGGGAPDQSGLVAERDALAAEVERLKAEAAVGADMAAERDALAAEIERLKTSADAAGADLAAERDALAAEVERLKAIADAATAEQGRRAAAVEADVAAERDALLGELQALKADHETVQRARAAQAAAEASAAEAIEALSGRVARLAAALQAH